MKHHYLKNVATLEFYTDRCIGCGMCTQVCPHGVFAANDTKVRIEDINACMECGACVLNCPVSALSVKPGVGCAAAIIHGFLTNSEPSCDCTGSDSGCC